MCVFVEGVGVEGTGFHIEKGKHFPCECHGIVCTCGGKFVIKL